MSHIPDRSTEQFPKFDVMDDSQLREILREDASKQVGEESNMEEILYIMELLANRKKARGEERDTAKAFRDFQEYYAPESGTLDTVGASGNMVVKVEATRVRRTFTPWKRKVIIFAACLALFLGSALMVNAEQGNIWNRIVKWTQETFHLGRMDEGVEEWSAKQKPNTLVNDLIELLDVYKVPTNIVPRWIPEGYEKETICVSEMPTKCIFYAQYINGDRSLSIQIKQVFDNAPTQFEQSDSAYEIYYISGYTYYLFENDAQFQATCVDENIECNISGDLTFSEIKQMIDSIKGED